MTYVWRCVQCGLVFAVERPAAAYDHGPTATELPPSDTCEHLVLERIVSQPAGVSKSERWRAGGGKGRW
jgi:hypothetical protein